MYLVPKITRDPRALRRRSNEILQDKLNFLVQLRQIKLLGSTCHARAHDPNAGKYPGLFGLAKSNKVQQRLTPIQRTVNLYYYINYYYHVLLEEYDAA